MCNWCTAVAVVIAVAVVVVVAVVAVVVVPAAAAAAAALSMFKSTYVRHLLSRFLSLVLCRLIFLMAHKKMKKT